MTDAERALDVLIHDLRTPIGVAQGYLRLIQDGRLAETADRERAIAKALHALGQTARLCQEAAEFIDASRPSANAVRVPAASFAHHLETCARQQGLNVAPNMIREDATLRLSGNLDVVCEAVITVVTIPNGRSGSKRASATVHMHADNEQLKFTASSADAAPNFDASGFAPFDRCWSHGLGLAVACRRIARSSGNILALGSGDALMVTFRLENGSL